MVLRIREKKTLKVSATSAEVVQFFDNVDDPKAEVINDELTQENDGTFEIAFGAQESLSFGDITAVKWVDIEADGDMTISIDGGAGIPCEARATSVASVSIARFGGTIAPTTSIEITNPAAAGTLKGRYVVVGDVSP